MNSRYSLVRGDRILPPTIRGLSSQVPCTGADLLRSLTLVLGSNLPATILLLPSHGPCTTCLALPRLGDSQTSRPPTRCASLPSMTLLSSQGVQLLSLSISSTYPMATSRLPLLLPPATFPPPFPAAGDQLEGCCRWSSLVLRRPLACVAISPSFLPDDGNIERKNEFLF